MLRAVMRFLCTLLDCASDGSDEVMGKHAVLIAVAHCLLESVATVLSRHAAW